MITSNDMCRRAGITYRQLDNWLRNDVLQTVDGINEPGSGAQRRFAADEAFVARACGDLVGLGMRLGPVRVVADQLRRLEPRTGRVFVDAGGGVSRYPWAMSSYVLDLDDLVRGLEDVLASR